MSNGVKLDIDNFLLGDRARFLLLSQEDGARGKKLLHCSAQIYHQFVHKELFHSEIEYLSPWVQSS